ncbi:MAG: hypothetical protein IT424_03995 [Pirellulales bacterium]|nr:hypothetical protein [Pirellulales bacterium]
MASRSMSAALGRTGWFGIASAILAVALGGWPALDTHGQDAAYQAAPSAGRSGGRRGRRSSPGQVQAMLAAQAQPAPGAQPAAEQAKPAGEQPKPGEEKKPEGEGDKKKEEEVKTIKRPTDKPTADAEELKVAPDEDGMVQFNFRGQPWPDVLQWFAGVAGYSLDWQELPADYLNLSTQRRHTLAETRDLLNRHLLARGFTMLLQGEALTVVKVDKLDPSLVPRVDPDELDDQAPHDFARARFPLPETLDPAKAVEDVKVLLSPAAKVTPLLASKQIQVIDAVANLRDVRDLLYAEQLALSQDVRPRAFDIRYRRADYIADQVMIVLGLDPGSRKNPMELQLEQQRMQLFMQMQQQGKDVTSMLKKDGPPVFLAVDKRRNVVLVNAPPKEMAIIERTVKEFDVPENGLAAAASDEPGDDASGVEGHMLTMKRHPTPNVSPDAVVTALKEMGSLDPLTQLQSDSTSKTIFAYATAADHATIEQMIQKLDDGTARTLHVMYLNRRTPADQIAGTVKALMVGEQPGENNSRRYYYYGYGGNNEEPKNTFRVQADIENNRLLLWANKEELEQVTTMLKDLGALAGDGGNPNRVRVLEARSPQETAELLKRLQRTWSGSNRLNINAPPPSGDAGQSQEPAQTKPAKEPPQDKLTQNATPRRADAGLAAAVNPSAAAVAAQQIASVRPSAGVRFATLAAGRAYRISLAAQEADPPSEPGSAGPAEAPAAAANPPGAAEAAPAEAAETSEADAQNAAPPINVTIAPDGRIILSSDDPAALDQLEELVEQLAPQRQAFEIFHVRNSRASMVSLNLEDYFKDELAEDSQDYLGWWWDDQRQSEDPATLGRRRKLRFIWDSDTNTIVVQNASAAQLETIRKLIEIYDQPVDEDAVARRRTDVVALKYSQAQDVAAAIKEVYRDLLSSKDKEFQGGQGERDRGAREIRYSFWGGGSNQKTAPVKMSFEGALSIGIDPISNSLIISADEQIWENVRDLAISLDEKAKPDTVVRVHKIDGAIDAKQLKTMLLESLSKPMRRGRQ